MTLKKLKSRLLQSKSKQKHLLKGSTFFEPSFWTTLQEVSSRGLPSELETVYGIQESGNPAALVFPELVKQHMTDYLHQAGLLPESMHEAFHLGFGDTLCSPDHKIPGILYPLFLIGRGMEVDAISAFYQRQIESCRQFSDPKYDQTFEQAMNIALGYGHLGYSLFEGKQGELHKEGLQGHLVKLGLVKNIEHLLQTFEETLVLAHEPEGRLLKAFGHHFPKASSALSGMEYFREGGEPLKRNDL